MLLWKSEEPEKSFNEKTESESGLVINDIDILKKHDKFICGYCQVINKVSPETAEITFGMILQIRLQLTSLRSLSTNIVLDHNFYLFSQAEYRQFSRILFHLPNCQGGPFVCELCTLECSTIKELNCHKLKRHKNELPFRCTFCVAKFERNSSLQKHLIRKHETDPDSSSYQCDRSVRKVGGMVS